MKKLLLLTLFIGSCINFAKAQKISIKKGIAYDGDSAYCKVSGKTGIMGTTESSFSILGMDDTELIFVKENENSDDYEFIFINSSQKIKISKTEFGSNWKVNIIKTLFKNKVIDGNKINDIGKNNFMLKYKKDEAENESSTTVNSNNSQTQLPLVDRNKEAIIFVNSNSIEQDFKKIGTFSSFTTINKNSISVRTYIIKLPTGEKVAEFKVEDFNAENNSLYIYKNDKTVSISDIFGGTVGQEMEIIKKVAEVLIENRSL